MAEQSYGDWIRSNPPLPTKEYKHMEQTAVEWFASEIDKINASSLERFFIEKLKNQAKQMEKEQIMNAFCNGDNSDCMLEQNIKEFAEQYYNETYNK